MSVITSEQQIALEQSPRFQQVAQQYVKFIAQYLVSQDGTTGNLGGRTPVQWAQQRNIAAGILLHPQQQPYQEWAAQMNMRLKGQDVWVADVDYTISAMINSGKFEELANDVFAIRGNRIEF